PSFAAEPAVKDLLRDGLYAEEVTRDSEAAARQYDEIIRRYSEQRRHAATAIFRLAEIRREQGQKDEAIKLYQRLLAEFPDLADQSKLAAKHINELGGEPPAPGIT